MRARAHVVAESDGRGGTRLAALRSEAPLVLRSTADALYLVGGAGGPLGGDELTLEIEVGPGARLTMRTAAASVAQPGPRPGPSEVHIRAVVAGGGELRWLPEPVVAAQGCLHHMDTTLVLEAGAVLVWREEVILGRHGESPGSVVTRTMADLDGAPLLRHELALGPQHPASAGPAVTGGARAVGSVLLVGSLPRPGPATVLGPTAAILRLAGAGIQVVVLAETAMALRRHLDAGMARAGAHTDERPAS